MPATATASTATIITEAVSVVPVSERTAALCGADAATWTAGDLTWYVQLEISRIHGPQLPRVGEDKIIPAFYERFGADGVRIARHAFEARNGMWKGAPVTFARFTPGNDDFFSRAILREINGA
jgi:hypothetical protein